MEAFRRQVARPPTPLSSNWPSAHKIFAKLTRECTFSAGFPGPRLRQILLRLPQPLNRPVDSFADGAPVEILLPAEPLGIT